MNKKAAELSLTIIVVAILALLVLVIMSFIFIKRTGNIQEGINECTSKGGVCAEKCGDAAFDTEDKGYPLISAVSACKEVDGVNQICCIKSPVG